MSRCGDQGGSGYCAYADTAGGQVRGHSQLPQDRIQAGTFDWGSSFKRKLGDLYISLYRSQVEIFRLCFLALN